MNSKATKPKNNIFLDSVNYYKKSIVFIYIVLFLSILFRITYGIVIDTGYLADGSGFFSGYWNNSEFIAANSDNYSISTQINEFPNTIWIFTQFTWLTAVAIFVYFSFVLFAPKSLLIKKGWNKFFSHRVFTVLVFYEMIVALVFWLAVVIGSFYIAPPDPSTTTRISSIVVFSIFVTIMIHAIGPISIFILELLFKSHVNSRETYNFIAFLKILIFPTIYMIFYLLIALLWSDPYPLTTFSSDGNLLLNFGTWLVSYLLIIFVVGIFIITKNLISKKKFSKLFKSMLNK